MTKANTFLTQSKLQVIMTVLPKKLFGNIKYTYMADTKKLDIDKERIQTTGIISSLITIMVTCNIKY